MLLLLPGLSGLLLIGSFPRANQGYLAWLAFIPLIVFVFRAANARRAFWGGFVAGAIEFSALLVWIPEVLGRYGGISFSLAWILYGLLVALLASYPGMACALMHFFIKRGGKRFLLLFPIVWLTLELFHTYFPFGGFPWLLAGYSQTSYLNLIQVADLAGVYGVSLVILWFNTAIAWIIVRKRRRIAACWPLITACALIIGCMLYGRISIRYWDKVEPDFQAAMLQGNLSFDESEQLLQEKFQEGYVRMADHLKSSSIDLLVLPESPSPSIFQYDSDYRRTMEHLAQRYSFGMIFNNISYEEAEGISRYFNSAYFLDKDGKELGRYDKMHLVPFGEYLPWKKLFFFVETISKDVGSFSPGTDYQIINLDSHPINSIICFEVIFPDLVRRFVREGSQLIVNLTNDGWYGDSAAPYQHLATARWRAVENRRYLLRATNSGISAFIEPTGEIQASTALLQEAICEGRFAFVSHPTLYTQYGDVLPMLCAIITFLLVICCVLLGRKY